MSFIEVDVKREFIAANEIGLIWTRRRTHCSFVFIRFKCLSTGRNANVFSFYVNRLPRPRAE